MEKPFYTLWVNRTQFEYCETPKNLRMSRCVTYGQNDDDEDKDENDGIEDEHNIVSNRSDYVVPHYRKDSNSKRISSEIIPMPNDAFR
ncbi:hypothetical protein BLOT_001362 [Blomia tropicalis]|nr:hypothetical protein BLOT_001362 [Blomia tropicalis]